MKKRNLVTILIISISLSILPLYLWGNSTEEVNLTKSLLKEASTSVRNFFKTGNDKTFILAQQKLNEVLKNDPNNNSALIQLAHIYNRKVDLIIDKLSKKEMKSPGSAFALGNLLLTRKRYEEAVKYYNFCMKKAPKWGCPIRHKGEALYKMGKFGDAVTTLKKCVEVRWDHFDAHIFLAKALYKTDKYKEAAKSLDNAIKIYKKSGGCKDEDGKPEAELIDCYKLYVKIYKKLNLPEKVKLYEDMVKKVEKK